MRARIHAARPSFRAGCIFISPGGYVALIGGLLPPGSPFDPQCPTSETTRWTEGSEPEARVAAIVNRNSITDVAELLDAPDAKQYALEWVGRVSNAKEPARQLSSVTFLRPGLPPIFTIHGDQDDVLGQGQARCVLPSIRWVSTTG